MTCIVGYKNYDGELFIAADSRITWTIGQKSERVYIDELQKLYFPLQNIVIAFSTNNLSAFKSLLEDFDNLVIANIEEVLENRKYEFKFIDHMIRLLEKKISELKDSTSLLVGWGIPGYPKHNRLIHLSVSNGKYNRHELQAKEFHFSGSIYNEESGKKFETEVIKPTFQQQHNLDILYVSTFFHVHLRNFQESLENKWKSVSPAFHSVHTDNGLFVGSEVEGQSVNVKGIGAWIKLEYDSDDGRFCQINETTNYRKKLITIDQHSFSEVPNNDDIFSIDS